VPAWKCGWARTGQLTATRGTRAGRATRPTRTARLIPTARTVRRSESMSILGPAPPDADGDAVGTTRGGMGPTGRPSCRTAQAYSNVRSIRAGVRRRRRR
jgi:hypothetical protein